MNWTKEQLDAIHQSGTNIIVSAGAGSGKTTVLTERVITKLQQGIKLNELLILTFTKNSAHDMKNKIKKAIAKNSELKNDANDIANSYISTFDSFTESLVKKYHYLLGLDKNINIIDSAIIFLKKKEIIKNIFNEKYEKEDENFINFVTSYCSKNDEEIQKLILNLDQHLDLIIDKKDYLQNYLNNFYTEDNLNNIFNNYFELIQKRIDSLKICLENLSYEVDSDYFHLISNALSSLLNAKSYEELQEIKDIQLPRRPKGSGELAKKYKDKLKAIIDDIISYTNENKTDLLNEIWETREHVQILIDILQELNLEISEYKKKYNSFEFNDISRFAINLLKTYPDIRDSLKYHFKEIMIDEYQDTNDIQEAFISLIENNNVYMVGDIKQSIYRFRNANPSIFKNKYDKYKERKNGFKIDLNRNFRSRKEVLEAINSIFNVVMDDKIGSADYALEHQMIFGNNDYNIESPSDYKLSVYNYEKDPKHSNDESEAFIVANDIKNKIQNQFKVLKETEKGKELVNCTYSDFCILMDRGTSFETYKKVFDYMQIPINIYQDEDILLQDETYLVKNILTLILKIKNREFDQDFKFCFTSIARSYLYEINDEEIFFTINNNEINKTNIYEICDSLTHDLDTISNRELLEKIIFAFAFYQKMIKIGNIQERLINLNNLLEKAENLNTVGIDIYGLIEFFNTLMESKSAIKIPAVLKNNDSVIITNIHKSKGLEYYICYYTGLFKKFNFADVIEKILFTKEFGFILPINKLGLKNTIIHTIYKETYLEEEISENIRLFYVALTRCKEKMIIVAPISSDNLLYLNKIDYLTKISYRSFLDIIISTYKQLEKYITSVKIDIPQNYLSNKKVVFESNSKENILVNEIEIESKILTKNKLSKDIRKLITNEEKANMEYGTKMHYILENIDFLNPDYSTLDLEESKLIKNFLNQPIMQNIKNAKIIKEYQFLNVDENNYETGIIDLLLVYDDHIDIIDYKLKNTIDEAYKEQLLGYKKFIENKTNKKTNTYLYSLINQQIFQILQ